MCDCDFYTMFIVGTVMVFKYNISSCIKKIYVVGHQDEIFCKQLSALHGLYILSDFKKRAQMADIASAFPFLLESVNYKKMK